MDKHNDYAIIWEFVNDNIEFYAGSYTGDDPRTGTSMLANDLLWHHYVYSYDGSTWEGNRDGVNIFSLSKTFNLAVTANSFNLARYGGGGGANYSNVELADVRIYKNKALSVAESQIIYNSYGTDNITDSLVCYWRLNEGSDGVGASGAGSNIDLSLQGNNLTPTNSPLYRAAPFKIKKTR